MGREEYQRYLASREWALKREAVRERSNGVCERCWLNDMQAVHHVTYAHVGNEPLEDLMAICNGCHEFESGKSNYDPRVNFTRPTISSFDPLRCPFCNNENLHHTRVVVFERTGEDGDSNAVTINGSVVDHGTTFDQMIVGTNPSNRRNGLLIYFWCEICKAGYPPFDPKVDLTNVLYEIPLALAVLQHKGSTFLDWHRVNPARISFAPLGIDTSLSGTFG